MPAIRHLAASATALVLAAEALAAPAPTPPGPERARPRIALLEIEGVINPLTARYLTRELRAQARGDVELVVVRLDTPGGLDSSMREMTRALLGSPVPVVVWVAPPGARAASAGMFLALAAHVAAMAPGTNIGAAHPVSLGGGDRGGDGGDGDGDGDGASASEDKITNDVAALARAVARERGRNAAWAERAVRESVSITAEEALARDVIDVVARDLDGLLAAIDGRTVSTPAGERTIRSAGAVVVRRPMSFAERILHAITDPNIALLLLTLGMIGLIAELYTPGMFFPGIAGALSLVLAFVALGSLPVSWAGLLLLLLAAALLAGELFTPGFGVLGAGAIAAFVLGALMLYRPLGPVSPSLPAVRVSPWLVVTLAALLAGFLLVVVGALTRARRRPVATGIEALLGRTGTATSALAPEGTVIVDREPWSARAEGPPVGPGDRVRVVGVEGVTLRVVAIQPPHPQPT